MFAVAAILPSMAVNPVATLSTSLGDIKVELFLDRVPRTASNFIDLAQSGEACRRLGNTPPTAEHSRSPACVTDCAWAASSQASTRASTSTASSLAS